MSSKPCCGFCKHSVWFEDRSVGIWGYNECNCPDIDTETWEAIDNKVQQEHYHYADEMEQHMAKICGHYAPKMAERCAVCKKEMNIPLHRVTHWACGLWDNVPVCSVACKRKYEIELFKNETGVIGTTRLLYHGTGEFAYAEHNALCLDCGYEEIINDYPRQEELIDITNTGKYTCIRCKRLF